MLRFWLIRRQPYRETSLLVTALTEQDQLVRGVIRGAHSRSEFELCEGEFSGAGLQRIQHVSSLSARVPLSGIQLISALYANEILYYLIPEGAPCSGLFEAYTAVVTGCARGEQVTALRTLERHVLRELGLYVYASQAPDEMRVQDRYYRLGADGQLVEVQPQDAEAVPGAWWLQLIEGQWAIGQLGFATRVHRTLIDRALGGRRLVSRELVLDWKKATDDS
ncbi:MAG: DNA repair protein RecO [Litorivicinaceae bacterium]